MFEGAIVSRSALYHGTADGAGRRTLYPGDPRTRRSSERGPAVSSPSNPNARGGRPNRMGWRDGLPGWTIQFMGPRVGMRGATFPQDKVVQVYVRPDESAADVAVPHG